MNKDEIKKILEIGIYAGRIMLENGAETSRVEDTINRICISKGLVVENFTIPTGIFLSYHYNDESFPYIIRTKKMVIDLERISLVNDFSREFVNDKISIEDAKEELDKIHKTPKFHPLLVSIFGGVAGSLFTAMFGGNLIECIFSFITSFLIIVTVNYFSKYIGSFMQNIVGGMINTFVALSLVYLFRNINVDIELSNIVIGSIMPLVPGVALVNALRDSISGNLVSGVSKLSEAMLLAVAIAIGVGVVLHLKILLTGTI